MSDEALSPILDELEKLRAGIEDLRRSVGRTPDVEEAPMEERAALQLVCSGTPDPMITIDHRGTIVSASASVQRVFGSTADELKGKNVNVLMPEPFRSQHDRYLSEHLRTGRANLLGRTREFEGARKDGSIFPCEVTVWRVQSSSQDHPLFTGIIRDITHRKHSETALRNVQTRLQAVMASTLDPMIIIRLDGIIQSASDSVKKVFDWSPQELIGQNINVLMPEPHHSNHDNYLLNYQRTGETNIIGETREFEAIRKDGFVFPCEITVWRVDLPGEEEPIFTGIVRDITERKRAEKSLEDSRQWLATTLTSIGDGVIATDTDGNVTFENPIAKQLTGWGSEAIGRPLTEVFRIVNEDTRQEVENPILRVLKEGSIVGLANHTSLIAKDGTEYSIADSASPVRNLQGEITGAVLVFRDVTDIRTRAARERQLREELAHVARLSTMGEMASGLAHELNQPLTAIANYSEACLQVLKTAPEAPAQLSEMIDSVAAQAQRAGEIIHRLRRLVQKRASQATPLKIGDAVREVVALVSPEARVNSVRMHVELPENLPTVMADMIQIEQVILNLVHNAFEAMHEMPEDQRELTIRAASAEDDQLELSVSDTGPGMSPAEMQRVFDPFFTTKPNGMGMGLSISRSIIEVHGGRMQVAPNPTQGVTFRFSLPFTSGKSE